MMSTPKPLHDTSADRSTKVMGLALRDVNESLAGSLGIAEGYKRIIRSSCCHSS